MYPTSVWDGDSASRDSDNDNVRAPDHQDWTRLIQEVAATQTQCDTNIDDIANLATGVDDDATDSVGTLETVSGLSVSEKGDGAVHKTIITLLNVDMTITDGSTPGTDGAWGTLKLYTFPEGHVNILGTHMLCPLGGIEAVTGGGTGLSDTADIEVGVGSVASANATAFGLENGTQEDIVEALDVDLTAKTSDAAETAVDGTAVVYDGASTASSLNLNARTLDDADSGTGADILRVDGTLTVVWTILGDN